MGLDVTIEKSDKFYIFTPKLETPKKIIKIKIQEGIQN